MIPDFEKFINESSLKELHGVLDKSGRKRMRRELRDNIITFKFKKRNGEIRKAHGTLHPDYLPPLRGGSPKPERQMVYYDLDKKQWRSFRSYSFIKILNIKPVKDDEKVKKSHKPEDDEIKKVHPEHKKVEKKHDRDKEVDRKENTDESEE